MESESRNTGDREVPSCGCLEPGLADPETCYCGVEDLLQVIRRRYSLAVLKVVHARNGARFTDIETALPSASTSTLSDTLRALTAARLLRRHDLAEALPRTYYTITGSGTKLLNRLRRLLEDVRPD